MRNPIIDNADAEAEVLTPSAFLRRLGGLLVVVLSVAVAANGLALLAGL